MRASSFEVAMEPSIPSAMFSSTVRASNNEKCWNTMPMPSRLASRGEAIVTGLPFQAIEPSSGCITP
jgi:hypothetical protein